MAAAAAGAQALEVVMVVHHGSTTTTTLHRPIARRPVHPPSSSKAGGLASGRVPRRVPPLVISPETGAVDNSNLRQATMARDGEPAAAVEAAAGALDRRIQAQARARPTDTKVQDSVARVAGSVVE